MRRPYTFVVMALLIIIGGVFSVYRMAVDIFPDINIPVVSVIWSYNGISAQEMERRFVTVNERAYTNTVNDIEHIESTSLKGVCNIKVYFHPGVKIEAAVAQLTSITQSILRGMPPGATPPFIIRYNATNVPIMQLGLGSETLSEQEMNDIGNNFVRLGLAVVQGATVTQPFGGKSRQIMVDLDPQAMYARNISPSAISTALGAQNVILPAGSAKMGNSEYDVRLNSSVEAIEDLNNLPVGQSPDGKTIFMRDVAHVHDGFGTQNNIVRQDGKRSTFMSILKNGGASTLDIISRIKTTLPQVMKTVPSGLQVYQMFDQSVFVKASINGVLNEGMIAALLTALMILIFLGSWRSTIIVVTSIPLSILCSIIILAAMGQTLNIMTLGGLALAVGILVDDATVEIENVHRNLAMGKPILQGILDGAAQIATPALVSTFSICIVFLPIFFLSGVASFLFSPFAMAVIFAMIPSYVLSRTIIPTMVHYLLPAELHLYTNSHEAEPPLVDEQGKLLDEAAQNEETEKNQAQALENQKAKVNDQKENTEVANVEKHESKNPGWFWRLHLRFNKHFDNFRMRYHSALLWVLTHKAVSSVVFGVVVLGIIALVPLVGEDFFPKVDAGQFRLHFRAPVGTRIEKTEDYTAKVEDLIRSCIPAEELDRILSNIGLSPGGINLAFTDNPAIGSADAEILVSLKEHHAPTEQYMQAIRKRLHNEIPELSVFYQPSDIVTQILNFGIPAPVDVQVTGRNAKENLKIARELTERIAAVPGAADVRLHQVPDVPQLTLVVDRTRANQAGLTQKDLASDMLISLSGSNQTAPNDWINPANGVRYNVIVQTPTTENASLQDLGRTPMTGPKGSQQILENFITEHRSTTPGSVTHYNATPTLDVLANVEDSDLGSVADEVQAIINEIKPRLPKGSTIVLRGQVQSMKTSFNGLFIGILASIVLVYLLMVVNFQSWKDPFIIITALPGALAGIIAALLVTGTTISVPSLMGAIMCIGVATSNSILMVTFANDERRSGKSALQSALNAGFTRLRPVLMTALAMIMGMLPMSLGLGEGGEQNAPLGRAVIGGLLFATATTLFIVPMIYSMMRRNSVPFEEDPELDEVHYAQQP